MDTNAMDSNPFTGTVTGAATDVVTQQDLALSSSTGKADPRPRRFRGLPRSGKRRRKQGLLRPACERLFAAR